MRNDWIKLSLIVFAALALIAITSDRADAEWQNMLDEHFQPPGDWDNPLVSPPWPWFTNQNLGQRWHWNPLPPHWQTELPYTDYSWGLQDFVYNTHETRNEERELRMSVWCARTNRSNRNEPRWPEDVDYMHNQNAWLWWGPIDVRRAEKAAMSFWVYQVQEHFARDSLTAGVVENAGQIGLNHDDFRGNVPWGYVEKTGNEDWTYHIVYFDSLYIGQGDDQDTLDLVGERGLYIYFAWQSNARDIAGMGAFIDDVKVSWDDGLFNLLPTDRNEFGYFVNEDSIYWTDRTPETDDEVYLRLPWKITGSEGEVPEFSVRCYIDQELFYSEQYTIEVDLQDSTTTDYITETDTTWTVPAERHVISWYLDFGDDVEESNENDNQQNTIVENIWNPPPEFAIYTPDGFPDSVRMDETFIIEYSATDSVDNSLSVFLYWTHDTSGYAEDPASMMYYTPVDWDFALPVGEHTAEFTPADHATVDTNRVIYICGFASDGIPGNIAYAIAPGYILVLPPLSVPVEDFNPLTYGIERAFPNPFNNGVSIEYTLPVSDNVEMSVFDLSGRMIEVLVNGQLASGRHQQQWTPNGIPGGVYMVRMLSGGQVFMQKIVYMP